MGKVISITITLVLLIIFISGVLFFIGTPLRIIGPTKIFGGNPGKYKNEQIVWTMKKQFYWGEIDKGKVVQYNINKIGDIDDLSGMFIAEVIKISGEDIPDNSFDLSEKAVSGKVPAGYLVLEKDHSGKYWLVPNENITEIVVYP